MSDMLNILTIELEPDKPMLVTAWPERFFDPDLVEERLAENANPAHILHEVTKNLTKDWFWDCGEFDSRDSYIQAVGGSKYQVDNVHAFCADVSVITGLPVSITEEWSGEEPERTETTYENGIVTARSVNGRHEVLNYLGHPVDLNVKWMTEIANAPSRFPAWVVRSAIKELLFRMGENTSGIRGS